MFPVPAHQYGAYWCSPSIYGNCTSPPFIWLPPLKHGGGFFICAAVFIIYVAGAAGGYIPLPVWHIYTSLPISFYLYVLLPPPATVAGRIYIFSPYIWGPPSPRVPPMLLSYIAFYLLSVCDPPPASATPPLLLPVPSPSSCSHHATFL